MKRKNIVKHNNKVTMYGQEMVKKKEKKKSSKTPAGGCWVLDQDGGAWTGNSIDSLYYYTR